MTWADWLKISLPLFASLVSLGAGGWLVALGRTFAKREDISAINERLAADTNQLNRRLASIDQRITVVEGEVKAFPTGEQLHADVRDLSERMARMEAELGGAVRQMATTNQLITDLLTRLANQSLDRIGR